MRKKTIIFDLDGTLLNTIGDLGESCNSIMRLHGYPEHDYQAYCKMVGGGIRKLVERAMPPASYTDDYIDAVRDEFAAHYRNHIDILTHPYEGIVEMLDRMSAMGLTLAVASNKFDDGTKRLIGEFFPHTRFAAVLGQRDGVPVKPDPAIVFETLELCATADRSEALYVGDAGTDMLTAANAGIESIGVSWGFRGRAELEANGADHIIDRPADIFNYI